MITATQVSAVAALLAAIVGLATLIRSVHEYVLQGTQKRAEVFFEIRKRLIEDKRLTEIIGLVQDDDIRLGDPDEVTYKEKYRLLGYFEEVALMLNSRLIRPELAWYMFGYYTLRIHCSENFWSNIHRDDLYWSVFNQFASKMERFERIEHRRKWTHGADTVASRRRMRF